MCQQAKDGRDKQSAMNLNRCNRRRCSAHRRDHAGAWSLLRSQFGRMNRVQKQLMLILCVALMGCLYVVHHTLFPEPHALRWEEVSCRPKSNLVFLKAHKCASSSIQNILMRYGYYHSRVFVLPAKGNYLGHPSPFRASLVPSPREFNASYNILTHHSRLNVPEMSKIMPNDTIYLTILRHPVTLFESMFQYYSMDRFWDIDFHVFNDPDQTIPDNVKYKRYAHKFGPNQMMFDLGFEVTNQTSREDILEYIEYLDSVFSLVMISERMDESLILLKHHLCWNDQDVVVFRVNARQETIKNNITSFGYERLRELNFADQLLYDHFRDKFDRQVQRFGANRMQREIEHLRMETKRLYNHCVNETFTRKGYPVVHFNNQHRNDLLCHFLTTSELSLTKSIRLQQLRRLPGSVFSDDI